MKMKIKVATKPTNFDRGKLGLQTNGQATFYSLFYLVNYKF